MSDFEFNCSQCGGSLLVDESARGKSVKCPHCEKTIKIPTASSSFRNMAPPTHQKSGQKRMFKVEIVQEGALGTLLVGSSKIPAKQLEQVLSKNGAEGWDFEFMVLEKRRLLLFWTREAVIITMSRPY